MSKKRYHFSCGNSTHGPVGFCAAVYADSEEEALAILKEHLPEEYECHAAGIDYITFYTNAYAVTLKDIDEVDEDDDEDGSD